MSHREIRVGLLGLGTVGSGVWKILSENRALIEERLHASIQIRKILVKDPGKKRRVDIPAELITTNPKDILQNPEIDVVVELIGGIETASQYILEAISQGKNIVTANKALLSVQGAQIFEAARKKKVGVGFEASVAGGIPIIKAIREGFIGNRIQELFGIINGTANFILSEMTDKGKEFADVLKEAQAEGYAEQDPTFDIKGIDAAQKLSILISLCYGVEPPQSGIFVEGIDHITPLDINFAKKLGYVIKLLAIAKDHTSSGIEARVHPTMVPAHHPLADVSGVFNAIFLKGDAIGDAMFLGRGAGMMPTASAVVSDIAMACNGTSVSWSGNGTFQKPRLKPMEEVVSDYYLRFSAVDKPGVLARIAKILGDEEISISRVYQDERAIGAKVPIVIMTHEACEKNIQTAIAKIDNMDVVLDKTVLIRMEEFKS